MSAAWSGKPASGAMERDTLSEGVAAYAANLALPSLSEATARKLAVGESLVTHLTSLVLVDEEGPLQEGLPVTRKVNLPTPRTAKGMAAYGDMVAYAPDPSVQFLRKNTSRYWTQTRYCRNPPTAPDGSILRLGASFSGHPGSGKRRTVLSPGRKPVPRYLLDRLEERR